jgi:hypothetical protein
MEEEVKAWAPRGGRPKKEAKERKSRRLNLCLTEDEFTRLQEEAIEAGYKVEHLALYAKVKLLPKDGVIFYNPKPLFNALDKLTPELKKVGTNINYVAKYVNYLDKNGMTDANFIAEYNQHFRRMAEVQHEYSLAIKAYLRSVAK